MCDVPFTGMNSGTIHKDMLNIEVELKKRVNTTFEEYRTTKTANYSKFDKAVQILEDGKSRQRISHRKKRRKAIVRRTTLKEEQIEEYEISDDEDEANFDEDNQFVQDDDNVTIVTEGDDAEDDVDDDGDAVFIESQPKLPATSRMAEELLNVPNHKIRFGTNRIVLVF
jgi:hypothetical protein